MGHLLQDRLVVEAILAGTRDNLKEVAGAHHDGSTPAPALVLQVAGSHGSFEVLAVPCVTVRLIFEIPARMKRKFAIRSI